MKHDRNSGEVADTLPRPSEQPVFYAAVAFSIGIICGTYFWPLSQTWLIAFFGVMAYAIFCCRHRVRIAVALGLLSLILLAALQVQLEQQSQPASPDLSHVTDGNEVTIVGHVVRSGLLRNSGAFARFYGAQQQEHRQTIDIETEAITVDDVRSDFAIGIRVNVHSAISDSGDDSGPELQSVSPGATIPVFLYGQRIQFPAKLREPRNYGNPGAMDYKGYLQGNGIVALASVKADYVTKLPGFSGTKLGYWRSVMRRSLVDHMLAFSRMKYPGRVGALFSMDEEEAGVLAAMIIGEQSLIQRDIRMDFQRTGTYHILVVSGMNVAILAFVIFWLAKRLRAGEVSATIITIVLSLLYAYMTDLGSPIVRAALMLSLYLGARLLYRNKFSLNSIGTAALIMLIASPQTLFEASFQLTFLSVVVLGGIIQPLLERTSAPYQQAVAAISITGYDAALPPKLAQFRLDLRMIADRISRLYSLGWMKRLMPGRFGFNADLLRPQLSVWLVTAAVRVTLTVFNLVLVTTIVQVSLALPMVIYFHRMAMLGLPSNMVVVPLTAVLMPVGIAATLLSYVSNALAAVPVALTALTLHGITGTVRHLGGVRFADVRAAMPTLTLALIAAAAFVFAMCTVRSKRSIIAGFGVAGLLAAALLLTLPPKPHLRPSVLEVTAIDVGQGDSILVVSPDGHILLIDGGGPVGGAHSDSFDIGEDVVSPYLWSRGITRLDAIALTHAHSDHLSGLHSVMANFKPRELWVGTNPLIPAYRNLLQQATEQGITIVHHVATDRMDFGQLHVNVLAPAKDYFPTSKAKNDDSLVLEISYKNTSALLAGDVEKKIEHNIANHAHHADLLKVAHHGSATSTTPELLHAVHPQYAVISVGYHSIYGHPKPEVLARLAAAHARTFRTDLQGAVTFYLDGRTVVPEVR